ncbi:MAG: RecQ family ATP-dependent DNA helicase [Saprospiraceae bacterium]|nr:RecQ family ATP-dependent DNA helicase [Saprospiraceae bacterium]
MQEDIIHSVLKGNDTLALLPTGGGKSICYQVPALCREGLCLVISPLIALMKDQVAQLRQRGIPAAAIYSGMSRRELDIVFENACNGAYKLLYLSPERLQTDLGRERIRRMQVNLLAVDEAHCVSQWGYDFRPPYLQIAAIRKIMPDTPLLALTATATPDVVSDILEKLGCSNPAVFQQSFQRANLSYSVLYEEQKQTKLLDILRNVKGSGLIYLRNRGETQRIAEFLRQHRISADFYHAGLSMEERTQKQLDWMQGRIRIMACTNAFGMGIDKPDVRLVIHLSIPDSLEAYFQEAGRAGRDGKKSYAVLLYQPVDADQLRYQWNLSFPEIDLIRRVYQALGAYTQLAVGAGQGEAFPFDFQHFCQSYRLDQAPAMAALRLLEQEGWILILDQAGAMPRVHITASREELYDYQLRNKLADKVTKVLLRAYPGIQNDVVEISTAVVARHANMPQDAVEQTLKNAGEVGILSYQPAVALPMLVLIQERVAANNLTIDIEKFTFRKERSRNRLEAAIRYAETRQCRSQLLLAYFGENSSPACGICDICTGRNREDDLPSAAFHSLEQKIFKLLQKENLPLEEILKAFALRQQAEVTQVLDYLLDEGKLRESADGKLRLPD